MKSGLKAVFWGGLACGVLDISQAFVGYGLEGLKPLRLLQGIAAALLGPRAFQGGWKMAALGLALHFLIAFTAAAVYYAASRILEVMTRHPVICGFLYGEMVWAFMNFVVRPLSHARKMSWDPASIVTGPIGHLFLVGLPIALAVRRWAPPFSSSR